VFSKLIFAARPILACIGYAVMSIGAGPAILKRLAALNRSGVLAKPLQYSQVKSDLASIDAECALRILNQLEVESSQVPDPIAYVKRAVIAAATPSSTGTPSRKRKSADYDDETAQQDVASHTGGGVIAKRIRLLNGSGKLSRQIGIADVRDALGSLGIGQAMTILKSLEDFASGVRDPTAYIRTAVRSAGGVAPLVPPSEAAGPMSGSKRPSIVKQEFTSADVIKPGVKIEISTRDFRGAKTEELTEAEKLERHIGWLNRSKDLAQPLNLHAVLPALDSIGYRQAMRVLRRFEETCASVADPDEFVKDLVARSGWIWSRPDIVDDDEKVAKRVAWLNQFGMLERPIDYAQVADLLDGLTVPHAMVLLRELEVQSHKVADPTQYIKKAVGLAGEDEVQVPLAGDDSSIAQQVASLNRSGKFGKPIDFNEVGQDLARLGGEDALKLLREIESKGKIVKDPTGYIKFKLKAKLASVGHGLEEHTSADTKILKRIEWINDYGGLRQDIDYNKVAAPLGTTGVEHAMAILKELEDKRDSILDPNAFILASLKASWKRSAAENGEHPHPSSVSGFKGSATSSSNASTTPSSSVAALNFQELSRIASLLNNDPRVRTKVKVSELAAALDAVGHQRATQILRQMQDKGLGLTDPLAFIRAAAQRTSGVVKQELEEEEGLDEETDDVARMTRRLEWLNQFAGLSKKIRIDDVVGALYCLGVPQTMQILRGLQEKGRSVMDPTWYIKSEVQRANGVEVTPMPQEQGDGEDELAGHDAGVSHGPAGDHGLQGTWGQDDEDEQDEELAAGGVIAEFEDPEGEDDEAEGAPESGLLVEYDVGVEDDGDYNWQDGVSEDQYGGAAEVVKEPSRSSTRTPKSGLAGRRVVGSISGAVGKLVPSTTEQAGSKGAAAVASQDAARFRAKLPMTPQEKLVRVRDYAVKKNLQLEHSCLKELARLPYHMARDLITDVVLGGRDRRGVPNPSRYLSNGCAKLKTGLGAEQGIAMELAVSLGVVLNNDALDELASIPRKEAHSLIRELATNAEACQDPLEFIQAEVLKCRAQLDARPWPSTG